MSASPTVPLRNALVAVLEVGTTILAGEKVYIEGSVPRTAALPYIVLGTSTETGEGVDRYNGQYRHDSTVQLKCWGRDKDEAERAYAEIKTKADLVSLTVTGHGIAKGRISKIADFAEPNPEVTGHQVIARYRIVTQAP